jgi:Methyl-accepting chemotaxis protein (MCP) signaling domain.
VTQLETATERAEAGATRIATARNTFGRIVDRATETADGAEEVANATDQQAASTEEITAMVDRAAASADDVSTEIDDITAANRQQVRQVEAIADSVTEAKRTLAEIGADDGETSGGDDTTTAPPTPSN